MLTRGLSRSLKSLKDEVRALLRDRRGRRAARARYSGRSGLQLNLGCGGKPMPGWVNIDLFGRPDVTLDLREDLPFPDGSAVRIYSEHFFEHLELEDARNFLREALRVLGPGGELHIGVPDTEWPIRAYMDPGDDYFRQASETWHPAWCDTRMHHLNYHFRQAGEHRYAYDLETLRKMLLDAGFERAERRDFDSSLDSADREVGTLYVVAHRAGA